MPTRQLRVKREALVRAIVEQIGKWKELHPQVEMHAAKTRQLVKVADKLKASFDSTIATLGTLGAEEEIAKVRRERAALLMQSDPAKIPLAGHSATIDLYLIAWRAIDRLRSWTKLHRPPKARPRSFASALATGIGELCKRCGVSTYETEDLLAKISDTNGLPRLSLAASKKRKQRAKRGRTK